MRPCMTYECEDTGDMKGAKPPFDTYIVVNVLADDSPFSPANGLNIDGHDVTRLNN